jgi:hypothetical protein
LRRPARAPRSQPAPRRTRGRIERFEEAVDLAPSLVVVVVVVVEESVQLRHHPSTGPHHDATNIVVIGRLVGDEDAIVIESAVGDEHVKVDVQLQGVLFFLSASGKSLEGRAEKGTPGLDRRAPALYDTRRAHSLSPRCRAHDCLHSGELLDGARARDAGRGLLRQRHLRRRPELRQRLLRESGRRRRR